MKTHHVIIGAVVTVLLLLTGLAYAQGTAPERETNTQAPLGTAFTYQGQLTDETGPIDCTCDLTFALYDAPGSGTPPTGGTLLDAVEKPNETVVKGLLTVTLDFGSGVFDGDARWLQIAVDCGDGAVTLSPRQRLTPAPYALYSMGAPWSGLAGMPPGFEDGTDNDTTYAPGLGLHLTDTTFSVDTSIVQRRVGQSCPTGSYIREIGAEGTVVCEPDDAGAVGDFWSLTGNSGTAPGTHFLGTTDNQALELHVNGERTLRLQPHGTSPNVIAGHSDNRVTAGAYGATIGGGGHSGIWEVNRVTDAYGTVGGGSRNQAGDADGTVEDRPHATVGGGANNVASGENATVAGGRYNEAGGGNAAVGGGSTNKISASAPYATVGGGYNNKVNASAATVGGGWTNLITGTGSYPTVGGGYSNEANGSGATVAGGYDNDVAGSYATVGGGQTNTAAGTWATVGGGDTNKGTARSATVSGGDTNTAAATWATIAGGLENVITATGTVATIGGGEDNTAAGTWATIGGGDHNTASHSHATVGGGQANAAAGSRATIGGGRDNVVTTTAEYATIGGGYNNEALGDESTISGGRSNSALGWQAAIGGGHENSAGGTAATVPGGAENNAADAYSFAAGYRAKADDYGSFVWADSTYADFHSNGDDTFNVRATGGFYIYTSADLSTGLYLPAGSSTWTSLPLMPSDRNLKENLVAVDPQAVLDAVAALPVSTWNFNVTQDVRHMGPMAQDFYAAFGLGQDDEHIHSIDADGVALAAIQGLHAQNEALAAENFTLTARVNDLETRLETLERAMAIGANTGATSRGLANPLGSTVLPGAGVLAMAAVVAWGARRKGGER